jgi:hypothetical protein
MLVVCPFIGICSCSSSASFLASAALKHLFYRRLQHRSHPKDCLWLRTFDVFFSSCRNRSSVSYTRAAGAPIGTLRWMCHVTFTTNYGFKTQQVIMFLAIFCITVFPADGTTSLMYPNICAFSERCSYALSGRFTRAPRVLCFTSWRGC